MKLVILFYFILFLTAISLLMFVHLRKILLLVVYVFWCSSSGDALAFAHFGSSSHGIVFLVILETMCHLSLGVWKKNTLFLFVSFCCCLYKIFKILLCFYFCLKFLHSTIEHTPVCSISDTGLRSSLHTLA
jgi:hypothetical protein